MMLPCAGDQFREEYGTSSPMCGVPPSAGRDPRPSDLDSQSMVNESHYVLYVWWICTLSLCEVI